MSLFGKSLHKWKKEFEDSGKWDSFELVRKTAEGWLVEVTTQNTRLTMELCRDRSAHIYDTHGQEESELIKRTLDFLNR